MRESVSRGIVWSMLAAILLSSLALKLNHLNHRAIRGLDEVFHAIVARNLLKHPLTPTLYERHYLEHDPTDWQNSTVWVHKPPMALWQIAGSFALFGETPLALRLPSVLLSTGAVWLTYLIGASMFNRRVGLMAALLHAFNPATFTLVHGYIFSDHIDVAMLFWTELGIYFLIRATCPANRFNEASPDPRAAVDSGAAGGSPAPWAILAGVAQGLALLTKTYPALIITGLAIVAVLLPRASACRVRGRHVLMLLATTMIIVAPWVIWCLVRFPREFVAENALILRHLHADVENWAGPWDRLLFDYLGRSIHVFYPLLLASMALLGWRAWRERDARLIFVFAWFSGVVIPHTLATSKTPSAALIGWPAGWLMIACLIDRALRGDALMLGGWLGATVIGVIWRGVFPQTGMGYTDSPRFAGVLRENLWYAIHASIALASAVIANSLLPRLAPRDRRFVATAGIVLAVGASATLFARYSYTAWRVTEQNRNCPAYVEIGEYVRSNLPKNAVMLVEETEKLEHKSVMFWTDRSSYPLVAEPTQLASAIRDSGGNAYLISARKLPYRVVLPSSRDGRTLYEIE